MIINPYNLNFNLDEQAQPQTPKIELTQIIKKISENILIDEQEYIENNKQEEIKEKIKQKLECEYKITKKQEQIKVVQEVISKIFGYGILQKYIDNKQVSDIRVVAHDNIYVKKQGIWQKVSDKFESPEEFDSYIRFCVMKNNAVINTEIPICIFSDKKNALRLEAGIAPANVENSSLVIRIHQKEEKITLKDLMEKYNMLNKEMYQYILKEVKNKKSFVICGKGGSGKTTLLKAIIDCLPKETAITTAEETAEMYLKDRNIISRECILNRKKDKQLDLEKLTRHSLVMSNDVLVLGELKRS